MTAAFGSLHSGLLAEDTAKKEESSKITSSSVRASLDRSLFAIPQGPNRMMKGTLSWGELGDGHLSGLFRAAWRTRHAKFEGKPYWNFPEGQSLFIAEIEADGKKFFGELEHLITIWTSDTHGSAYYAIDLHREWIPFLKKAHAVTITLTGRIDPISGKRQTAPTNSKETKASDQ
jgi:hypothetical protein